MFSGISFLHLWQIIGKTLAFFRVFNKFIHEPVKRRFAEISVLYSNAFDFAYRAVVVNFIENNSIGKLAVDEFNNDFAWY